MEYVPIPGRDVPITVRFDTPGRHQGQIIEVAYGEVTTGRASAEHDHGATYRRVLDRSTGAVEYAKRTDDPEAQRARFALDRIAATLRDADWTAETLDHIAEIVREAGHPLTDATPDDAS